MVIQFQKKVQSRIPDDHKEGHKGYSYGMILAYIRDNKIRSKKSLIESLENDIKKERRFLARKGHTGSSTMSSIKRDHTRKLEYIQRMLDMVKEHL